MSEPNKYREWILETIDSLRSRKARPDLERICRMVRRRHGSDPDRTRTELEKLIEEQTVLKVSYKGSISYRNAAKAQRKSRKKSEFTGGGGGGGAEAAKERSRHDRPNNNGDSLTDQEEGEEDSEPSPDAHPETSPSATDKKLRPSSGDVGSGCKEETGDEGSNRTSVQDGGDGSGGTNSRAGAVCGGGEPGWPGAQTRNKTCSGSVSIPPPQHTERQPVTLKPKLGVGGTGAAENRVICDPGDRSVAPVRSPSERSLRGPPVAPTRGPVTPLGLKEILGYLSSQERLSEGKLTRGKVRVVMEREVARGRLRRTRCGDIALPLRGSVVVEGADVSADRLTKKTPQDKRALKKENEPMETAGEEEEREENDKEEEDPRSSEEDGGLSPVAMTMEPQSLKTSTGVEPLSSHQQQQLGGKGVSAPDALTMMMMPCPPVQGGSLLESNSPPFVEESAIVPDPVNMEAQNQMQLDRINHNSSSFDTGPETKTEIGVSSCLLTPTASPRDSSMSEEQGMNGGVSSGGSMKCEVASGSPVDWTVSDVVSYFTAAGFPEQAAAFSAQEIDGKSLLLMQRSDVLTGLSIRLGPALKIYERHVKALQKMHFEEDDS